MDVHKSAPAQVRSPFDQAECIYTPMIDVRLDLTIIATSKGHSNRQWNLSVFSLRLFEFQLILSICDPLLLFDLYSQSQNASLRYHVTVECI